MPTPARPSLTTKGVVARGLAAVLATVAFASWVLTQRAAWRLGFHSVLGKPWLPALPGREGLLEVGAWALWGAAILLLVLRRTRVLAPLAFAFGVVIPMDRPADRAREGSRGLERPR